MSEAAALMASARAFAQANVAALAQEILDWRSSGLLCDGKLRRLALFFEDGGYGDQLQQAEHLATRAALERACGRI